MNSFLGDGTVFGYPLLLVTVFAALILYLLRRTLRRGRSSSAPPPLPDVADPKKQLDFVSRVEFETQPLFNRGELQVLLLLEEVVRELDAGHRVMAQTNLGEFLRPKRRLVGGDLELAFRSINSKRADFVVVDHKGIVVLVVEYQGRGHYQGTALLRDAVKREAFRTAGVTLIEVMPNFRKGDIAQQVRKVLLDRVVRSPWSTATY